MSALTDAPHLPTMGEDRGREIGRRFEALNISDREWHKRTGIDRKTLQRAIEGLSTVRGSTYDAIESNLDKLEASLQRPVAELRAGQERKPGLVRFEVTGVYGADALVVEGPIENIAELQAAVDRIMRGSSRRADETQD